jgi:hypothetical protein
MLLPYKGGWLFASSNRGRRGGDTPRDLGFSLNPKNSREVSRRSFSSKERIGRNSAKADRLNLRFFSQREQTVW